MRALLGTAAGAFFTSFERPPSVGLRVNTLKLDPASLTRLTGWQLAPLPWTAADFTMTHDDAAAIRPGRHPWHDTGLFYLQDPSAMAVAEALAPQPGEWILDLAAAPGGKATHLASLLRGRGLLVANDPHPSRIQSLGRNLERCGVAGAVVVQASVARLAERLGPSFDRVLLDAPCSGEGMFRKSAQALTDWSETTVHACAGRQAHLLADAARLVRPGGRLGYSTCTFAPEENEQAITGFLGSHPDFELEPVSLPGSTPGRPAWAGQSPTSALHLERSVRLWPHLAEGEGHFMAIMRRSSEHAPVPPRSERSAARELPTRAKVLWRAFVAETLRRDPAEGLVVALQKDRLMAVPANLPSFRGVRTLRSGLWLGTLKKDRIEPAHALALACPAETFLRRLDFAPDDPRLSAYLHGHPLEEPGPDGWLAVTVTGFPIAWGRRNRGIVQNAYPKGLRKR